MAGSAAEITSLSRVLYYVARLGRLWPSENNPFAAT